MGIDPNQPPMGQPVPAVYPQPQQYAVPPMANPGKPGSMTLARVVIFLEAVLGLLCAAFFVFVGVVGGSAISQVPGIGAASLGGAVAAVFIAIGVVVLLISILFLWAGVALGKFSQGARWTMLIFAGLQLVFGLLSLASAASGQTSNTGAGLVGSLLYLAVAIIVLYGLGFSSATRRAFAARSLVYAPAYAYPPAGYAPPPSPPYPGVAPSQAPPPGAPPA